MRRDPSRFPGEPDALGILLAPVTCMKDGPPAMRTRSAWKLVVGSSGCLDACGMGPGIDGRSPQTPCPRLMSPGAPWGCCNGLHSKTSESNAVSRPQLPRDCTHRKQVQLRPSVAERTMPLLSASLTKVCQGLLSIQDLALEA